MTRLPTVVREDLSARYSNGEPPLYRAIAKGSHWMTSKLWNNGADIEARLVNHWTETPLGRGETALFAAVCDCKDDIVKSLLEAGAHLEVRNSYGESVLYQAVGNVTETWTKILLLMGADEKAETSKGNTPLDVVRRENRWATVETMGALRHESFVNPPLERKLRMLTEHELKEQASNVRPILADGDCIDLEVF
jgi:hypothetical protein